MCKCVCVCLPAGPWPSECGGWRHKCVNVRPLLSAAAQNLGHTAGLWMSSGLPPPWTDSHSGPDTHTHTYRQTHMMSDYCWYPASPEMLMIDFGCCMITATCYLSQTPVAVCCCDGIFKGKVHPKLPKKPHIFSYASLVISSVADSFICPGDVHL